MEYHPIELLNSFRGQFDESIIITGATSFIAINFINEIINNDINIYAVVRPQSRKIRDLPKSDKIIIIESEMKDYNCLDRKIDKNAIPSFILLGTALVEWIEKML